MCQRQIILLSEERAILDKCIVEFQYVATGSERRQRKVEPLKLVFRGSNWYLYAFCLMRNDYRFFKLKRMQDIIIAEEKFNRQVPKQVLQRESIYDNQPKIKVTLKLEKEAAFRAMDDFADCVMQTDGSAVVSGEYIQGEWLIDFILSYGVHCEVVEPLWLREKVRERLVKILGKYVSE